MENKRLNIPKDILDIHSIFKLNGFKLFVVGGAVRDFIMGNEPSDFDLVTNASPEQVIDILKDFNTDLQGVHFGVVRVFTKDEPEGHEIASYRKDISKGRDNKGADDKVEIGEHITIDDDVKRRDLTMNALFYDIDTDDVVEIVGGVFDIENRIVRCVGDAHIRFNEDRLRILRTLRFAVTTGSKINTLTALAIKSDNRLFGISDEDDVSRERIFKEFKKVSEKAFLNNDNLMLARFINLINEFGIMEQIFPNLKLNTNTINPTTSFTISLAQVLIDNNIDNRFIDILKMSKLSNRTIDTIIILINLFKNDIEPKDAYNTWKSIESKGISRGLIEDWIDIMEIKRKSVFAMLKYEPNTSGNDIIKDGFKGREIGEEIIRRESIRFKELLSTM